MTRIDAHITGNVWKVLVEVGDRVQPDEELLILESMKMEIPVESEEDGIVEQILCEEGQSVTEGDSLIILEP